MKQAYTDFSRREQFRFEITTMKRILNFIVDDNIHLKHRLAAVAPGFDQNQLEHIENFQNRFIMQDELAVLLNRQLSELNELLAKEIVLNRESLKRIKSMIARIFSNLNVAEARAKKLRKEFNNYLSENIGK